MSDDHPKVKPPLPDAPMATDPFIVDTLDCRVQSSAVPRLIPPHKREAFVDADALEPYSRAFHDKILTAHHEWRDYFGMIVTECGRALYVEIPAPSAAIELLCVSTEDQRLTVGIGINYHCHFDTHEPETDDAVFERAIQFLDDFVQEKLVLANAMLGEVSGCSWLQRPEDRLDPPEFSRDILPLKYDRLRVVSWRSTYDREIPKRGRESG